MSHPHASLLKEFQISIEKLVPLTPPEIVQEGKRLLTELQADEGVTEKKIHDALVYIGRKEFPYRKAYEELCASDEEQRLQLLIIQRLDPKVWEKIHNVTHHGVMVMDYVNSPLFEEQLTGDERYQVEQAILLSHDVLNTQCSERATSRKETYEQLVARWKGEEERMQGLIDALKAMADRDAKWRDEIAGKVAQFEEGWSIVERDPSEEEIRKELEYWGTVLAESEDDQAAPLGDNLEA